jgi:hypothetical protein
MRNVFAVLRAVILCFLLAGCERPSPEVGSQPVAKAGSCGLGLPEQTSQEQAIWALIGAESTYVVSQETDRLMGLWAVDAQVSNLKGTPQNPADDQTCKGYDAIRYRYTASGSRLRFLLSGALGTKGRILRLRSEKMLLRSGCSRCGSNKETRFVPARGIRAPCVP